MQWILILLLLFPYLSSVSQSDDVEFRNVEARFVSIPDAVHAYHPGAEEYPTYEIVKLDRVWYPERDYFDWFGDVDLQDSFAIFFTGELVFPEDSWYNMSLHSDDGSILWLNDKEILNNDGNHPMRYREQLEYCYTEKEYQFKIWYFQDYPEKMGIEFNVQKIDTIDKEIPQEQIVLEEPKEERIVLDAQVLFKTDSHRLSKEGRVVIDSIGRKLTSIMDADFLIEGHTDNTGTDVYNQALSLKRANAVKKRIALQQLPTQAKIITKAYGSSMPISDNETEKGRMQNRRVEIKILYK